MLSPRREMVHIVHTGSSPPREMVHTMVHPGVQLELLRTKEEAAAVSAELQLRVAAASQANREALQARQEAAAERCGKEELGSEVLRLRQEVVRERTSVQTAVQAALQEFESARGLELEKVRAEAEQRTRAVVQQRDALAVELNAVKDAAHETCGEAARAAAAEAELQEKLEEAQGEIARLSQRLQSDADLSRRERDATATQQRAAGESLAALTGQLQRQQDRCSRAERFAAEQAAALQECQRNCAEQKRIAEAKQVETLAALKAAEEQIRVLEREAAVTGASRDAALQRAAAATTSREELTAANTEVEGLRRELLDAVMLSEARLRALEASEQKVREAQETARSGLQHVQQRYEEGQGRSCKGSSPPRLPPATQG
eukprot:Hpha_TRINITY_DN23058_c0_g1::TRINITY_DN23058_c0_g1_i2::g.109356::m.109356